MLGLSLNLRCCNRITNSLVLLGCFVASPLNALQYWEGVDLTPRHFEQDWILRYLNSIDEDTEIGEVVDFLVVTRNALDARGYQCPSLMELAIRMKEYLINDEGIEMDEEEMQALYEEIYRREELMTPAAFKFASTKFSKPTYELCKHKKGKKEIKMKSKSMFGFLKCLAGGLICIIPIPAVQAVGAGLVLNGINDIIDDAREQGDENERLQMMDEQRRQEAAILQQP